MPDLIATKIPVAVDGTHVKDSSITDNGTTVIFDLPISVPTHIPASASAVGVAGMIAWDANFLYVCTATNTWKRVAIATW